ncbi:MAG: FAD-dependent oxidoreductase [Desulfofustis sp.]|nr:FAD-dependent oxidoreductase [Desulfofustis sp.]
MNAQKIAIIGSGIAGLSCAHALASHHDITVFEAADYVGGHTRTVGVEKEGERSDIDTGFIVFNDRTYPHFMQLMDSLGVGYQPTEMSFSVKNQDEDIEYNGHSLNRLFGQRRNLIRPRFLSMVADIVRFNREVKNAAGEDRYRTIGEFLERRNYSQTFTDNYLLPMVSAIWSMGLESCMDFPLDFFVRFFDNHGLLNLVDRPQWYTIKGGSSSYIKPLTAAFKERIRVNTPVLRVERDEHSVTIITEGERLVFDHVVFACHAPQALALLADPSGDEKGVLGEFRTSKNEVTLHTDESLLPKRKTCWASWNYNIVKAGQQRSTLTYHMNILQRLQKRHSYLVTLNQEVQEQHILRTFTYHHPVYTRQAIDAQQHWSDISGRNRSHFCGAYWFNGFHEDGVVSGLRVASALGGN